MRIQAEIGLSDRLLLLLLFCSEIANFLGLFCVNQKDLLSFWTSTMANSTRVISTVRASAA